MRGRAVLAQSRVETTLTLRRGESLIVALGWSPAGGILLAVLIMALGTVAFAGIGFLMAGTLRAEATLALANGLYLTLLLLGGMAFPLERLPPALEDVARVLPAAPLAECLRGALTGTGVPGRRLAVLLAWAVG